ncbi:hypothetical protein FB451DRAFT_1236353 [Mycena latifolia]|nr:hypothetical protein FB451DRAFT_1236353 [Mycena latifolia]
MRGFSPQFPLPRWMASLTHLDFQRRWDPDGHVGFVGLVAECPALVHLSIDTSSWNSPANMDRIEIPSLKSLHALAIHREELMGIIRLFDTPALTDLTFNFVHGTQICDLFNATILPHLSFPTLTSLSFVHDGLCTCDTDASIAAATIPFPPLRLFPVLTSLTLINQCFTAHIVDQILGPASRPWPLLENITLCPTEGTFENLYSTLRGVIHSKRDRAQAIPKFRVSRMLFKQSYWDENGVNVELFDPREIVAALAN